MTPISLLNWMLLSTALLGAWWACYRLALRQERSFAYNRVFLVLGPLLAAGLPLLPLAWPAWWWGSPPAGLPGALAVLLPGVEASATAAGSGWDWAAGLRMLYLVGVALMLLRLVAGLSRLWWSTHRLPRMAAEGYTRIETHGQLPTSSFGQVVFWDETLPLSPAEAAQVLRHELAHARQGHTYDRLLLELLRAALWFNPFVHLCGWALALTHEYLADEAALYENASPTPSLSTSYTQLLARQVASRLGFSVPLAHSFSHSQTLHRIAMIQKTNPIRRWKQWLALPLLAVSLLTIACEKQKEVVVAPSSTFEVHHERLLNGAWVRDSGDIPPPPPPPKLVSGALAPPPPPPSVYTYVEQMPQLPGGGGNQAIIAAIQQHLAYPQVAAADQRTGRVFASFIVTDKGEVQAAKIVKGLGAAYDEAVLAAIQKMPKFEPGKQDGKAVSVSFTVPILFATATLPTGENVKIISK